MSDKDQFVRFDKVDKSYDGEILVVKDLNLDVPKGEFLTMLGPSGSGKTTVTGLKLVDNMDLNSQDVTGTGNINITGTITATSIAGTVTGVTQSASDNSTKLATTAYVDAQVATENTLLEMDDVTITTPANNQQLVYNAATSKWVNSSPVVGATEAFAVGMAIALG